MSTGSLHNQVYRKICTLIMKCVTSNKKIQSELEIYVRNNLLCWKNGSNYKSPYQQIRQVNIINIQK